MVSVSSASEAKTRLPRLLKHVQAGERFVITRHNRPVAELIPFRTSDAGKIRAAIDDLKAFQRTHDLGGLLGAADDRRGAPELMCPVAAQFPRQDGVFRHRCTTARTSGAA